MKIKKKIIILISLLLLVLIIIVPFGISIMIYHDTFGGRYETAPWMTRSIDEFIDLKAQKHTFASNNGQLLSGYTYYKEAVEPKGIVMISHGLGGGQNTFIDVADYLTTNGYMVFTYDATGYDKSEGDAIRGVPQGVIDLDYAIRFIENNENFNTLPILLFGHSWGAYSAGSVLNIHPEIKAVVMIAGFNRSMDIIEEKGRHVMGGAIGLFVPYLSVIERIMFGTYSAYSCIDGLENSDAGAMIIHSVDDDTVLFEKQYQRFYEKFNDNQRFSFVQYNNRGHDCVYYTDTCRQYKDGSIEEDKLLNLDTELMDQIVVFYDNYAK